MVADQVIKSPRHPVVIPLSRQIRVEFTGRQAYTPHPRRNEDLTTDAWDDAMVMNLWERLHFLHRAWKYRWRAERDEIGHLLQCDLQGQLVVDIGANRGVYSYWMHRHVGPQGTVVAFEPQPELAMYLEQVQQAFRLQNLQIVPLGLSSEPGIRTMVRPRQNWGGGSLEVAPTEGMDDFPVHLTTLDAYFDRPRIHPVRMIKCDVEGHEFEVFRGGRRLLAEDRPELLFECHDWNVQQGDLMRLLASLDYEGYFFFRRQLVPFTQYAALRKSIDKPYLNFVFRPRDRRRQLPTAA